MIEPSARLHDLAILLGGSLRGDITIETDLPVDLWSIEIDVSELELALLNLCINARDAMPNGGVVRLSAANRSVRNEQLGLAGDYVVIELADNGTGIPPEILPRVFDPFFTTKDVGAGTGLGLSQVHGFSHQSGGALAIDSVVGQGTTVKLYLPASPSAAAKSSAAEPAVHEHRALAVVLVVEDDVDVADTTTGALERCGFTVKRAYRSGAALELLTQGETVDLVFSDIVMPDGMNGIELAEEVGRRFPRIPVLLATGYSDALADATAKGLQIISKPYRPKELCACIAELLGKHPP